MRVLTTVLEDEIMAFIKNWIIGSLGYEPLDQALQIW